MAILMLKWRRIGALDPAVGREIQKTRLALIIQNDISNRVSGVTDQNQPWSKALVVYAPTEPFTCLYFFFPMQYK